VYNPKAAVFSNLNLTERKKHGNLLEISHRGVNKMNKRTMKKMAKAKQQAAEAAKTAETVVKTAAPAKEVKRIKRRDQNLPERRAESRLLHRRRTGI
jgi:hypothetical protein